MTAPTASERLCYFHGLMLTKAASALVVLLSASACGGLTDGDAPASGDRSEVDAGVSVAEGSNETGTPDAPAPLEIIADDGGSALALTTTDVYVTDGGLRRIPKVGGAPTVLRSDQTFFAVAVDSANLYTTDVLDVLQIRLGGTDAITLASDQAATYAIATDAEDVYWIAGGSSSGGPGALRRAPIGAGPVVTLVQDVSSTGLAVDAAYAYFTDTDLHRVAKQGGPPSVLGHLSGPIALRDGQVYGQGATGIEKVPVDGGPSTIVAKVEHIVLGIAVDAAHVYWTESGPGTFQKVMVADASVRRAPVGALSIEPEVLASDLPMARGIALDDANVYFVDARHVYRLPKPAN